MTDAVSLPPGTHLLTTPQATYTVKPPDVPTFEELLRELKAVTVEAERLARERKAGATTQARAAQSDAYAMLRTALNLAKAWQDKEADAEMTPHQRNRARNSFYEALSNFSKALTDWAMIPGLDGVNAGAINGYRHVIKELLVEIGRLPAIEDGDE